jgi:pantoate--beta-alanine ligase
MAVSSANSFSAIAARDGKSLIGALQVFSIHPTTVYGRRQSLSTTFPIAMPTTLRTLPELRSQTADWRGQGLKIAVVPTMGALHAGHLALIREGLKRAQKVVVSIFVNPKQFGANEDLSRYPRDEAGDLAKLAAAGAHAVWAPSVEDMYPQGFATTVSLAGPGKAGLEDKFRPHFFDGVATVVAKLFIQTGADFAMFGEKDFQQLVVVTRMARDLDLPTEVIPVPTIRESDGLALSSRNRYLSSADRLRAPGLHRALLGAAERIRSGTKPSRATAVARRSLTTQGFKVDYVAARNAETLEHVENTSQPIRVLAAAWLGTTRLIDNVKV